jgi:hypothetical protein
MSNRIEILNDGGKPRSPAWLVPADPKAYDTMLEDLTNFVHFLSNSYLILMQMDQQLSLKVLHLFR